MVLAKQAGLKPRELAEHLSEKLSATDGVTEVDVAGPGFINLRLSEDAGATYFGRFSNPVTRLAGLFWVQVKVNVEYVSANPTGPLHIGHARGTSSGTL